MDDDQGKTTQVPVKIKKNTQKQEPIPLIENDEEDQGFLESLKEEWNLFWASIKGDHEIDDEESNDPFENGPYKDLTIEQVKDLKKSLSSDKKRLNQRLEALKKEIDSVSARIDNLKMVGGSADEAQTILLELNDFGQNLSEQLSKIDRRIKQARDREQFLKEEQAEL